MERELQAWDAASTVKKSEFALKYAIAEKDWVIPRYIEEGLAWLVNAETEETEAVTPEEPPKEWPDA